MIRDWTNQKMNKLPSSIFKKIELEVLILKNSSIRTIQKEIGNLTNLRELDLSGTCITELPKSIGKLSKLETLNLSRCYELKKIPIEINQLKKLKTLIINYFPGEVPNEITLLQNLEELYAEGICGSIEPVDFPKWIVNLKNIKVLDFSRNSIRNLPKELTELSELVYLNLRS